MRELVLSNVAYWVREFHVDGFRIDAAQQIYDVSPEHVLAALTRVARETAAPRSVIVVAEHEPQHARLMRPVADGGYGMDGVFNEDLHHSTRVALTGTHEAYTSDYRGTAREWLSAALLRLPVPGPVLSLAVGRAAARPRSIARATSSSASSRTTTRSPTPRSGAA